MKFLATLAFLGLFFCYASAQCTASLNATRQATWVDNMTQSRSLWTVVITAGQLPVSNIFLNIVGDINQIWEVSLVNGTVFQLPAWRLQIGGIPVGTSHVFGFIVNNNDTASPVSIVSVQCPNVTTSPSPTVSASPAASASPSPSVSASVSPSPSVNASASPSPSVQASASPSPSVNASASPSPSVQASASPSPSANATGVCSLVASQVARSGAGGSWTDNSNRFQIYDITLTNNGTRSVSSASVTVNIASDQAITQFWNLSPVNTSSNTFSIASFLLPAPGRSQDDLGYILRTPLNSTSDGTSLSVSFAC